MTRRTVALAATLTILVVAAAGFAVRVSGLWPGSRTPFEQAVAMVPSDTQRYNWTDWSAVRDELGLSLGAQPDAGQVRELIDRGFDKDLTSTSALTEAAQFLRAKFGWSPATADWELLSQSATGTVDVVRLSDGVDFDDLADRLSGLGFTRPDHPDQVWVGGEELLASISAASPGAVNPTLENVALIADRHLVLISDSASYLSGVVDHLGGHSSPVDPVVGAIADSDPITAAVYTGDYTCRALAMAGADTDDQAQADALIAAAGKVDPLTGFAISRDGGDSDLRVAMSFESDEQARRNAVSRQRLASGPAPGQGGSFTDRFTLGEVVAHGSVVTMELKPKAGAYVLSDLSSGPLLFATC